MVAYLTNSDASEGFNPVIDFLNGSYIKYALTVNPDIYMSCIKQFWNTVVIKQDSDITRRVGKGFSSVETPLFERMFIGQGIEEGGDADEHFEVDITTQGDDTAAYREVPTQAADFPISLFQEALDACAALTRRVEHLEYDKVAQAQEITKLKRKVKKLEKRNRVKVLKLRRLKRVGTSQRVDSSENTVMDDASNQGRIIDELDKDDVVSLMDDKEEDKKDEEAMVVEDDQEDKPVEVHEVVDVVTTAKLITKLVTAASEIVTAASTTISAAEPKVPAATIIAAPQQVEMDEEYARKLHAELNKDIDWDVAIEHVKQKAKEDPAMQRYQVMKKRPQTEAQARKNMIMYLKNVAGFRLDYFKEMSYDDIRLFLRPSSTQILNSF
nr:hypothetical protein [Tanacetum cinerariifolium]